MIKYIYKAFILNIIIVIIFDACGSDIGGETWGIDGGLQVICPTCLSYSKTDMAGAMEVKHLDGIQQSADSTILRIWHYQNGKKFACTLQGKAIVEVVEEGN